MMAKWSGNLCEKPAGLGSVGGWGPQIDGWTQISIRLGLVRERVNKLALNWSPSVGEEVTDISEVRYHLPDFNSLDWSITWTWSMSGANIYNAHLITVAPDAERACEHQAATNEQDWIEDNVENKIHVTKLSMWSIAVQRASKNRHQKCLNKRRSNVARRRRTLMLIW